MHLRPFYVLQNYKFYDIIHLPVGVPSVGCEDPVKLHPNFWMKNTPTKSGWRAVNNVNRVFAK